MKEELSKIEVIRWIWISFEVYIKYRVELGIKNMEKREKIHILGIFESSVPVHLECVPVHPSRTQSVPVHIRGVPVHPCSGFPVLTSFRILAITCSFLIRIA